MFHENLPVSCYVAPADQCTNGAYVESQAIIRKKGGPGPYSARLDFHPLPALRRAAKTHGMWVVSGGFEPAGADAFFNHVYLIDPDGDIRHAYHRCQPAPPDIDRVPFGRRVQAGDALQVVDTPLGRIGILICSEIYSPELCRLLALEGAETVFIPAGGMIYELADGWRTLIRARAIENHYHVVVTQNLFGMEDGLATIATSEGVVAERRDPGLLTATLDLDRLTWLRSREETLEFPKPYKTILG